MSPSTQHTTMTKPSRPLVTTIDTPTPADGPISPVTRTSTFPHKTSPAAVTHTPLIDTNTPAINAAPIELDAVATTPAHLRTSASPAANPPVSSLRSPADEEDIDAEFLAEGGGAAGREAREVMLNRVLTWWRAQG